VITIGLTGGIGCGKSAAAAILAELGAVVIDADKVGHQVYRPGTPCWHDVVAAFGDDIVAADGTIDREALGARVFADPQALRTLNGIVWPHIADAIAAAIADLRAQGSRAPVVVEAAVLIEAGWQRLVDEVWVVVTAPERAIGRVTATRGLSRGEVERRIASQISESERTAGAACVVRNDGTLDDLRRAIEACWRERVAGRLAATPP